MKKPPPRRRKPQRRRKTIRRTTAPAERRPRRVKFNDPALVKRLGLEGMTEEEQGAEISRRIVAAAEQRKPGRPPGKKAAMYNLTLKLDVLEWLRNHPDGPAAVADRVLRAEMEREARSRKPTK